MSINGRAAAPIVITATHFSVDIVGGVSKPTALYFADVASLLHMANVSISVTAAASTAVKGIHVSRASPTACLFAMNVTVTAASSAPTAEVRGIDLLAVSGAVVVADSSVAVRSMKLGAAVYITADRGAVVIRNTTLSAVADAGAAAPSALFVYDNDGGLVMVEDSEASSPGGACITLPSRLSNPPGTVDLRGVRLAACKTTVESKPNARFYTHLLDQNCVRLPSGVIATTALVEASATTVFPCDNGTPRTAPINFSSAASVGLGQCRLIGSIAPVAPAPATTLITGNYTAVGQDLGHVVIEAPGVVSLLNVWASGIELKGSPPQSDGMAAPRLISTVNIVSSTIGGGGISVSTSGGLTSGLSLSVTNTSIEATVASTASNVDLGPLVGSSVLLSNVSMVATAGSNIRFADGASSAFSFRSEPVDPSFITMEGVQLDVAASLGQAIGLWDLTNVDVVLDRLTVAFRTPPGQEIAFLIVRRCRAVGPTSPSRAGAACASGRGPVLTSLS